jgi:DNA-binding transcriptional LysR family regulator
MAGTATISDSNGEWSAQGKDSRLPSLLALRCFEAAARHENFSRAAAELCLTHSAVSRAVRLLEDDLGLPLFERRSRRVFLTEAGRQLARGVHDGLDLIRKAAQDARTEARRKRHWVLSCEPTLLMRWLLPRWPAFQASHPDILVHLVAAGGPFSFEGGIDLAIRRDDFAWPAEYHAEPLFVEKVGPVCRPASAPAWFSSGHDGPALNPDTPRLHTLSRPNAWAEWMSLTNQPAAVPSGQTFEHFYFSLQAAVAGIGVAISPWHLVRDDIASGALAAPLGFVEDGSRYWLLSPAAPPVGSDQSTLIAWLKATG